MTSFRRYLAETSRSGAEILADWKWLTGSRFDLWHVTLWGDALLRARDGSIHLLDTASAELVLLASDEDTFVQAVAGEDGQDEWLRASLVDREARLGKRPGPDQCLGFRVSPSLGAPLDSDNIEVHQVVVYFAATGQLHRQLQALPADTPVRELRVDDHRAPKPPWWRFWSR